MRARWKGRTWTVALWPSVRNTAFSTLSSRLARRRESRVPSEDTTCISTSLGVCVRSSCPPLRSVLSSERGRELTVDGPGAGGPPQPRERNTAYLRDSTQSLGVRVRADTGSLGPSWALEGRGWEGKNVTVAAYDARASYEVAGCSSAVR